MRFVGPKLHTKVILQVFFFLNLIEKNVIFSVGHVCREAQDLFK